MSVLAPAIAVPKDPSLLSWPPTLPIELALKTASPPELQAEYGYSDADWLALSVNEAFLADLTAAVNMVKEEGMSFKLKSRLIAEDNLTEVYKMVRASHAVVPPATKAKLIELCAQWAGLANKSSATEGGPVNSNALNIQINLGSDY